jgi:hypothetical protein
MASIPTEVLVKRRDELLAQIDALNVRVNEIERWLGLSGEQSPVIVTAQNPRKLKREQERNK